MSFLRPVRITIIYLYYESDSTGMEALIASISTHLESIILLHANFYVLLAKIQ